MRLFVGLSALLCAQAIGFEGRADECQIYKNQISTYSKIDFNDIEALRGLSESLTGSMNGTIETLRFKDNILIPAATRTTKSALSSLVISNEVLSSVSAVLEQMRIVSIDVLGAHIELASILDDLGSDGHETPRTSEMFDNIDELADQMLSLQEIAMKSAFSSNLVFHNSVYNMTCGQEESNPQPTIP